MTGIADLRRVRWLFFDVGNTLFNEEAATEARLRQLVGCLERHGRRCSIEDVRRALQEASAEFAPRRITAAIAKLTDDPDLRRSIEADHVASGILLAMLAIAIGVLNAAAMSL